MTVAIAPPRFGADEPHVLPPVSATVPQNRGSAFINSRGVVFGEAGFISGSLGEWIGQDKEDPTHLLMVVTNNVLFGFGANCCAVGFHFAGNEVGREVAEWADDPFSDNYINPWSVAESAYGCSPLLEVGDPVYASDFTEPGNTFDTNPYADGYWHLQDEVFLPWMTRQVPNTTSQATQQPSADVGRYTLMGDLNPYDDFHKPTAGC
jgi:hypothetical protein